MFFSVLRHWHSVLSLLFQIIKKLLFLTHSMHLIFFLILLCIISFHFMFLLQQFHKPFLHCISSLFDSYKLLLLSIQLISQRVDIYYVRGQIGLSVNIVHVDIWFLDNFMCVVFVESWLKFVKHSPDPMRISIFKFTTQNLTNLLYNLLMSQR